MKKNGKEIVNPIKELVKCNECGKDNPTICSECFKNLKISNENLKISNEKLNTKLTLIKNVLIKNHESVKESVKSTQQQYFVLIGKESCLSEVINLIDNN